MGGRPCLRGLRVTVGGSRIRCYPAHAREEILKLYPYLEEEDIVQAVKYARVAG